MGKLMAAYVYDAELRDRANQENMNYWYEYIREINCQLGLCSKEVSSKILEDFEALSEIGILFIGDMTNSDISDSMRSNLDQWVRDGGNLISFATEGLDSLFGNSCKSGINQAESDFDISGYFSLNADPLTVDIHSYLHPEQKLIIFSKIRCIIPNDSTEIAHLYLQDKSDSGYAAITKRSYGKGNAYYFAFNVPQTIWVLHQGIPITHDRDGDGYYRTGDMIAIGDNDREVLYADEIVFLIQNMIAQKPQPLIHQLPPKDKKIADAMFYWGGDDEAAKGTQLWASNWVREKGLPYHINIMRNSQGEFTLTQDEIEAIQANGHECSLHYNFIDNFDPFAFTEDDIKEQMSAFHQKYGFYPVTTVNHWVRWTGWADTAKWMKAAGGKADNSYIHHPLPPLNPSNRLGFVFGTSFPFYFYDDYKGNNEKIDFLEEPITAYEIGYSGSDTTDFDIIYKVVDIAAKYHLIMDMFYHPINVYNNKACRDAIEEVLRYIDSKGIIAVHRGNDGAWEWWDKRSRSYVSDVMIDDSSISFTAFCEYEDGMIVKLPLSSGRALCDGEKIDSQIRRELGQDWLYIVVAAGTHRIEVK